jgi:hypothetical protein
VSVEDAHHQTHISPEKHLCRVSSAQWETLSRIVTSDETWVHHYEPLMKIQPMEWHHPLLPCKKNSSCKLLYVKVGIVS